MEELEQGTSSTVTPDEEMELYLDWKENGGAYVIDIECDSLTPSIIWCMCWMNANTGETGECIGHEQIRSFFDKTHGSRYVGHNILKFDAPCLVDLCSVDIGVDNCIDTLVLSTLYSPSLSGGHSLDAWGERLGKSKIHFNDFSRLTPEMITYCHRDVEITCQLFRRLTKTLQGIGFTEGSVWLQHHLQSITHRQHLNGFYFDGPRAIEFYRMLRSKEEELTHEIRKAFPPERVLVATRQQFKKDGSLTSIYEKDKERYIIEEIEDGKYNAFEDVPFAIGSPNQRVAKLIELGWEPEEFTPKTKKGGGGHPKPFDKGKLSPSLEKFLEDHNVPEVELIAKWMSINGRANMVNTWLENWNEDDSCIHGKLFVADTLRFRHQAPNTANIPAVRTKKVTEAGVEREVILFGEDGYFTYEARDLWCARPGRVLVGTDASGLELRMLAHYLNRPDFTNQVINGDPHQYNADLVGISRPSAKTLIYAIMYGAQAPKIAKTLGISVKEGGRIRAMFLDRLGLGDLIAQCEHEQQNGRVELIDGSHVICPSPHAALNYKLQGGGARVMGLGTVLLERAIKREELDSLKVGDIHDEYQYDVDPYHAERHASLSVEAIRAAGRKLSLKVPLDAEAKIGKTWACTH